MYDGRSFAWPSRWERWGVWLLLVSALAFGVLVEVRSAFLTRRMGDFNCYSRAAWAVHSGENLYDIADDNGWHYNYPPLLAIVLLPLADPPQGVDGSTFVPHAVAVALWYCISLGCVAVGVHALANALEGHAVGPKGQPCPVGCRRWWALRLVPLLTCLPPLGHSLMRGQVNPLVLALFCGMTASVIRGHSLRGGICLAGAICIKVYPAFLLIYPIWRRDTRFLGAVSWGWSLGSAWCQPSHLGQPARSERTRSSTRSSWRPALGSARTCLALTS
ncbi:MAG: DUF2029 domain-containing protein [Gemmataceae bacterium]|nr:DUF2029 domain-containing protein [Gemmataceae bacterium]